MRSGAWVLFCRNELPSYHNMIYHNYIYNTYRGSTTVPGYCTVPGKNILVTVFISVRYLNIGEHAFIHSFIHFLYSSTTVKNSAHCTLYRLEIRAPMICFPRYHFTPSLYRRPRARDRTFLVTATPLVTTTTTNDTSAQSATAIPGFSCRPPPCRFLPHDRLHHVEDSA